MTNLTLLLCVIFVNAATVYAETEEEFHKMLECVMPANPQAVIPGQYVCPRVASRDEDHYVTITNESHKPKKWLHGIVPYVFGPGYDSAEISKINATMNKIMETTKIHEKEIIHFKERDSELDYIKFVHGTGNCSSAVGRIGGEQEINLDSGCVQVNSTIYHEILHALGMIHEHNRVERNQHLDIDWLSIPDDWVSEFRIYHGNDFWDKMYYHYQPIYDFESVMHYRPGNTFGCGEVMKASNPSNVIKRPENGLSDRDSARLRNYYNPAIEDLE